MKKTPKQNPWILGLIIYVSQFFIAIFLSTAALIDFSNIALIGASGVISGILIGLISRQTTGRKMPRKIKIKAIFAYFIIQLTVFITFGFLIEQTIEQIPTTLSLIIGSMFFILYSLIVYLALIIGEKNYTEMRAYKIPKNFLKDIIVYGILTLIFHNLIYGIDHTFFYDRRLQSHAKIEKLLKKKKEFKNIAILVSGSGAIISHISGFHGNLQASYNALKKRGYTDTNIIILSSIIPKGRKVASGITTRPTKENFKTVMDFTIRNIDKTGSIVFYFTGHGSKEKSQSALNIGKEKENQKDLYSYFKLFQGEKIFIFDQCYSGGFLKELKKLDNIAIMASTIGKNIAMNTPIVERIFWEDVGSGKDAIESYKGALKKIGHGSRFAKTIMEKISRSKNYYLTYKKGKANIARV